MQTFSDVDLAKTSAQQLWEQARYTAQQQAYVDRASDSCM